MGRRKQPAGTQRTEQVLVRFKPETMVVIKEKLQWMHDFEGETDMNLADLVRWATWEYCRSLDDKRKP